MEIYSFLDEGGADFAGSNDGFIDGGHLGRVGNWNGAFYIVDHYFLAWVHVNSNWTSNAKCMRVGWWRSHPFVVTSPIDACQRHCTCN